MPQTLGRAFATLYQVKSWLRDVFRSNWFRKQYPDDFDFELYDGRGCSYAHAYCDGETCYLTLPRNYRDQLTILHETAHCLVCHGSGHGADFVSTYLKLVRRFLGREAHADLLLNCRVFGVEYRRGCSKHAQDLAVAGRSTPPRASNNDR